MALRPLFCLFLSGRLRQVSWNGCIFTEEQYLCTEEFKPQGDDELALERGAVVEVIEKNLEGWWVVR